MRLWEMSLVFYYFGVPREGGRINVGSKIIFVYIENLIIYYKYNIKIKINHWNISSGKVKNTLIGHNFEITYIRIY